MNINKITNLLLKVSIISLMVFGFGFLYNTPNAISAPSACPSDSHSGFPIIQLGSKNIHVGYLQKDLNLVDGAGLIVDDDFGSLTRGAVVAYQDSKGILTPANFGIVDSQLWNLLASDVNNTCTIGSNQFECRANVSEAGGVLCTPKLSTSKCISGYEVDYSYCSRYDGNYNACNDASLGACILSVPPECTPSGSSCLGSDDPSCCTGSCEWQGTLIGFRCSGTSSVPDPGDPGPGFFSGGVIPNPLTSNTLEEVINKLINILIIFATPIFALMVIISAYQFMVGGSNPAKRTKAKSTMVYAIIGYGIILLSKVIISLVLGLF